MSFAKPPTYRIRKSRGRGYVPKTPKPPTFGFQGSLGSPNRGNVTGSAFKPASQWTLPGRATPPSSAQPPAGASPPPTNAPTQDAPITATPPPETVQGALDRNSATDQYNLGIPDINHSLWEAAFNYGGAPQAQQFGYAFNPATGKFEDTSSMIDVGNNPNSKLAGIARQLGLDTTNLSDNLNKANSYFSGAHVDEQGKLDSQAGRDRLQAQQDYEDAVNNLITALGQARHDRDVGLSGADIEDLNAATAVDPTAQDNTAPDASTPGVPATQANVAPKTSPSTRYPHGSSRKTLGVKRVRGRIEGPSKNVGLLSKKRKK